MITGPLTVIHRLNARLTTLRTWRYHSTTLAIAVHSSRWWSARLCFVTAGDDSIRLTINTSIGIAVYPKDGRTADALIKSADAAMYQAKLGESRIAFSA